MILAVEELRGLIPDLTESDSVLRLKLDAIEKAIKGATNNGFERYMDCDGNIVWPDDIKYGVLELIKWDQQYRAKMGVQSETISRHSVTYAGVSADQMEAGYPAYLMAFLDPYRKARF